MRDKLFLRHLFWLGRLRLQYLYGAVDRITITIIICVTKVPGELGDDEYRRNGCDDNCRYYAGLAAAALFLAIESVWRAAVWACWEVCTVPGAACAIYPRVCRIAITAKICICQYNALCKVLLQAY
ncbi:hypothetical protein [Nitrososphaera viennensis]|uniref:hypothetical protein n=1 Tax=Nitrososphaera viennensis TaxID=1034015 RepID=UPI0009465C63|nr:hypothetical protein [Nitrososphaera viennensis]